MHVLCGVHIFASTSFQGGFAKVKLGRHILTGEKVAIKIMNKKDLGVSFVDAGWSCKQKYCLEEVAGAGHRDPLLTL